LLNIDQKSATVATGKKWRTIAFTFASFFLRFYCSRAVITRAAWNSCTKQDIEREYVKNQFH
jgi:hypothetical protein